MESSHTGYNKIIYDRCVEQYHAIVSSNPAIDAGHSVNHVKKVEQLTYHGLTQFLELRVNPTNDLKDWITVAYNGDASCLDVPADVGLRVMAASLLHEVGDSKFNGLVKIPKAEIITLVLQNVFHDYPKFSHEFTTDIINMIEWAGAATWGNRIPEGSKIYQLIVRFGDRVEATGIIGIVRTMTFSYVKRATYPLVREEDDFPTSFDELEKMAPQARWDHYSTYKKPSISGFSHYLDKIVHISGKDVPIPYLRDILNDGQKIVKQFVIDFTIVHGKKFNIDWILDRIDPVLYNVEVKQLKEMREVMLKEGCKWITA